MTLGASASLLVGASQQPITPIKGDGRDPDTGEKRTKLRRYEHTAPQVLNVAGVSPIHECSNKSLWASTMKGNKSVAFYSEFCSEDAYRQGVAGSRHAETMLAFGQVLEDDVWASIINKPILDKVKAEFNSMKSDLEVLNGGKASQKVGSGSLFDLSRKKEKRDPMLVKEAAAKIYDWLSNETSAMRGFLQIMSWGGIFYAAMCSDKVTRCAIDKNCGGITKERYQQIMIARLCGDGPEEEDDNSNAIAKVTASLLGK